MFSELSIEKKRIEVRKLSRNGLDKQFIKMFVKLLEYVSQVQKLIDFSLIVFYNTF